MFKKSIETKLVFSRALKGYIDELIGLGDYERYEENARRADITLERIKKLISDFYHDSQQKSSLDSLNLEIAINQVVIDVLKERIELSKSEAMVMHPTLSTVSNINQYRNGMEKLIRVREQFISKLRESNIPTFDFSSPSVITAKQSCKIKLFGSKKRK